MIKAMARPLTSFPAPALALVVLFGACQSAPKPSFDQKLAAFMRPYEDLKRQKAELWRFGQDPQVFEFEDAGTVTVRHWELAGWPGEVFVSARITYENTTETPVESAFVWLEVIDSKEQVAGTTAVRIVHPMGWAFWPGHTYTTVIRAATNGAHLDPDGWSWSVACEARPDDDPGNKPVLLNPKAELARWYSTSYQNSFGNSPAYRYSSFTPYVGPHVPGSNPWW